MSTQLYATDLTDAEGTASSRCCLPQRLLAVLVSIPGAACPMRSFTSSVLVALGAFCRKNGRRGRRFTTIFICFAAMEHGSAFIRRCASACGSSWVVTPSPAQAALTANRSRPRMLVACGGMTAARRSRVASAICWSIPRAWCSRRRSTPPISWIATGSNCSCRSQSPPRSRVCGTCGSTLATMDRTRARTELKRRLAGRRRSWRIPVALPKSGSSTICPTTRSIGRRICLRRAFACSPDAGWWSGRSHGKRRIVGSARIMSGCAPPLRPSSTWR